MPRSLDPSDFDRRGPQESYERRTGRAARAAVPEDAVSTGPVKFGRIRTKDAAKGFGFIRDDAGSEYFFHRSESQGRFDILEVGDRVSFKPMKSSKGLRAHEVTQIDADPNNS